LGVGVINFYSLLKTGIGYTAGNAETAEGIAMTLRLRAFAVLNIPEPGTYPAIIPLIFGSHSP